MTHPLVRASLGIMVLALGSCAGQAPLASEPVGASPERTERAEPADGTASTGVSTPGDADTEAARVSTSSDADTEPARVSPSGDAACAPSSFGLEHATQVRANAVATMLGGCGFRAARGAVGPMIGVPRSPRLRRLEGQAGIDAAVECPPGRTPNVSPDTKTYFELRDVHLSSDDWELVFAVDDGERVHLGMRLARACQGVVPYDVPSFTAIEVEGRDRAVTLHTCAMRVPSCGPVP